MIEESLIVRDTRKIRSCISKRFGDNADLYIDYLVSQKSETAKQAKCRTGKKSISAPRSGKRTKSGV